MQSKGSFIYKTCTYGLDENNNFCYIYSYLLNWKQCVQINNINSDFLNDFSAAPQESVVGKFYWIVSLITFFRVIQSANAHNFADDDTLTALEKSIQNLIHLVESECCVTIKLFQYNKMIVNPGNFQAIILHKKKNNHTQEILKIDKNAVKIKSSVRLVGVQIDAKLNFNLYIASVSLSPAVI